MDNLTTLGVLAFALDPAVVLAVWALACLAAVGVALLVAWLVQPRNSDPFGDDRPRLVTNLWTETGHRVRHGLLERAEWRPMHTRAAVKRRGRHHRVPAAGRVPAAVVDEFRERAA